MILIFNFLGLFSTNLVIFSVLWIVTYTFGRISWIDFFWSFIIGAWSFLHILESTSAYKSPGLLLLSSLCFLWSLRLSAHLALRLRSDTKEDRRYEEIKKKDPKSWVKKSFFIFIMNAFIVSMLVIPQRILSFELEAPLYSLQISGALIALLAILGEAIADIQLKMHLKHHAGTTCKNGLWRYSRHPNYFFEWLFWVAIFFIALPSSYGWWALSAPVLMFIFLNYFTGIKISETNAENRRKDFAEYKRKTSAFFLCPPKKN